MSPSSDPTTRTATWADLPRSRALLADAYADDPLMSWVFPDPAVRRDATAAWLGLFLEASLPQGAVDVVVESGDGDEDNDERVVAVAAWRPPEVVASPEHAPAVGGLLSALVGPVHAAAVGTGLAALRPHAPTEPSSYLQFLAVEPAHQRRGLGGQVLRPGLQRAASRGLGVHLETASAAAVPFYAARGFAVRAEVDLPGGGPHLWLLGLPRPEVPGAR